MLYEKHKIYILIFTVMLHIIKQIKGGFMGFIESKLLSSGEVTKVADVADQSND